MLRARTCVWFVLAAICPAALAQGDFLPPGPLEQAGLVKYWQLQLILEKGQRLEKAYLVDDYLYLGTQDGYVFALHAPTGLLRWLRPISRSGYPVRRPCHVGDRVIFVTPSDLQIYERRTGDPVVRHDLRFPAGTGPLSDGVRVFIGGLDRRLYAFDLRTLYIDWEVLTEGAIRSTPVIQGELLFFANDQGSVYACVARNKVFRWRFTAYGPISADLVADDRGIFVACQDYSLYLIDPAYGNIRWRTRFSAALDEPPVLTTQNVYQYCPADGLCAVDATTIGPREDRILWKMPSGRAALTTHEDRVYILTQEDTLVAANAKDGTVMATVPANDLTLPMPAPGSSTVFLASPDGRIFCARPLGVPPLQESDLLAALRAPGAAPEAGLATTQPSSQPAAPPAEWLATQRPGPPSGGKSKVTREYKPGTGGE
jgi:outer membrane protein assembly factor BamB